MTLRRTLFIAVPVLAIAGAVLAIFGASTALEAPQAKSYTVGLISNNPNGLKNVEGFRAGLQELGYVDGENTTYLFAGGQHPSPSWKPPSGRWSTKGRTSSLPPARLLASLPMPPRAKAGCQSSSV